MDQPNKVVNVRTAQREDATALAHFLSIIDDQPLTPSEIINRMEAVRGLETPVLALVGGQAAGFACLRVVPSFSTGQAYAELTELYVEKTYLGGEIERAFIERLSQLARQGGATHLALLTGLQNTTAQALYRGLGFRDYAIMLRKFIKAKE